MEAQRGFTLVEVLVASAIGFTLGWLLVWIAHATVFAAAHLDMRLTARAATDRLAERMQSDAASAWSIFVPDNDVLGASNADGHELDFVSEDASHRTYWWAYTLDAAAQRVTVYAYAPASTPVAGDTYDGITALTSRVHSLDALAQPSSQIYDPLFAGAKLTPVELAYRWNPKAIGGNRLVRVDLAATGVQRTLLLASGTAPTRFTVVVDYTPPPAAP